MNESGGSNRRDFFKVAAAVASVAAAPDAEAQSRAKAKPVAKLASEPIIFPRDFTQQHLKLIAFPLGGAGAGALSLGGRGQLRDWEIFNRADKGAMPAYAFPSIWAQGVTGPSICRVLEARILPPFQGPDGLGAYNAPGLSRLATATFTGEYPFARIQFEDPKLPVNVHLEAFSPFIPLEPDDSGLPAAVLRYSLINPTDGEIRVSIAYSIENPLHVETDSRKNEFRTADGLAGFVMTNPGIAADHPMSGSFIIATPVESDAEVSNWRGWPAAGWWNSPLHFWDKFSEDGELGPEPMNRNVVAVLNVRKVVPPRKTVAITFFLGWRFAVRTPGWCGWEAPPGLEGAMIGNFYSTRFPTAWDATAYLAKNLPSLETKTRLFAKALRESTLPGSVKDAASANLSTLASTTCFRTADGNFHGFEGVNNQGGCCFGNCAHVWNYETVTPHLFPTFARSLRGAAFGYSMDDQGAIHFRQLLPDGKARSPFAAADAQMGQIVHGYLDWSLSGDRQWLTEMWPRFKKALEFAWIPGGWDANKDGVMEGAQHNTYDVEFYGPNPMCGIYYLAALRACEEMARVMGDSASSDEYRGLWQRGGQWIDANLFNGTYYIQKIKGLFPGDIAPVLLSNGAANSRNPESQVGDGCLVDQLIGQCMAEVAGLGPVVSTQNVHTALASIFKTTIRPISPTMTMWLALSPLTTKRP